jgi:hypothetical protein
MSDVNWSARREFQVRVWEHLRKPEFCHQLALGGVHPQCLFEQSKPMESGLTSPLWAGLAAGLSGLDCSTGLALTVVVVVIEVPAGTDADVDT